MTFPFSRRLPCLSGDSGRGAALAGDANCGGPRGGEEICGGLFSDVLLT